MNLLRRVGIPGVFVTGTDTGVGKTVIAGGIADYLRRRGRRVGVCKIAATGCEHRREGLVSEDAEFLAVCADSRFPLHVIAPVRYAEPLAPAVAAARKKEGFDWEEVQRSLEEIARGSDVMVVEGVGGIMVPMDERHTVLDAARWLGLPTVVAARAGLGTINHSLLTVNALRGAGVDVAGVVVNRYPTDLVGVAEETNPWAIEKWGKVKVLTIVPDEAMPRVGLPEGVVAAMGRVDWEGLAGL